MMQHNKPTRLLVKRSKYLYEPSNGGAVSTLIYIPRKLLIPERPAAPN
jgi:hypothetical protein